jgi:two-component system sensor histidine kinase KdpD
MFDNADQVELVDIEPQELIERLREKNTADSKLTVEQLTALREIAFKHCADRVKRQLDQLQDKKSFHTDEHILACLSSAPSNAKIIRTAARMAKAFNSQFTVLFVETPDFAVATTENKQRLRNNRKLAEQLGANIETVYGDDVPYQIAEFARLSGITKIVLGQSAMARRHFFSKPTLAEQLLSYAPEMDIYIIPDRSADVPYKPKNTKDAKKHHILKNSIISGSILLGATLLSVLFDHLGFTDANIIMVYILGVLLTSIATFHPIYSLISSIASVLIFNFLFTTPRFSLMAYDTGYPVTFVIMFLTAYITGTLAMRYKAQAGQSAKIAQRTKVLFDTDQLLSKANGKDEILHATAEQIQKLLERNIVIFENVNGRLSEPRF